ncbi:UNVERIFIED_ORG: hypothetical protein ABIB63_000623 [Xanthomonas axonopodis]
MRSGRKAAYPTISRAGVDARRCARGDDAAPTAFPHQRTTTIYRPVARPWQAQITAHLPRNQRSVRQRLRRRAGITDVAGTVAGSIVAYRTRDGQRTCDHPDRDIAKRLACRANSCTCTKMGTAGRQAAARSISHHVVATFGHPHCHTAGTATAQDRHARADAPHGVSETFRTSERLAGGPCCFLEHADTITIGIKAATPDAASVQAWAAQLRNQLKRRGWPTQIELAQGNSLAADE